MTRDFLVRSFGEIEGRKPRYTFSFLWRVSILKAAQPLLYIIYQYLEKSLDEKLW